MTLEAYFGKRSRVAEDDQNDDIVVVSTGRTALEMIADAYADEEDVLEAGEQPVTYANPDHVEHDHSYAGPSSIPAQSGGAFGFDSSDDVLENSAELPNFDRSHPETYLIFVKPLFSIFTRTYFGCV